MFFVANVGESELESHIMHVQKSLCLYITRALVDI